MSYNNAHSLVNMKIIILGDSGVGKSCILLRFSDDTFTSDHMSTIGVDFKLKTLEIDNQIIKLSIWDTAGQERFRRITSSYYRGADGILLVFDLTSEESFNNIKRWIQSIEEFSPIGNMNIILVGNKCDQTNKRVISNEKATNLANEYKMKYFETSAKSNINISQAFTTLAKDILKRKSTENDEQNQMLFNQTNPTANLDNTNNDKNGKKSKCC